MSLTISLGQLKCNREINESSASEEPYVLVTAVDLRGGGVSPPNFRVFLYGVFEDVDAGDVVTNDGPAFWGVNSTAQDLDNPDDAVFVISLMENDNGDPEQYRVLVRTVALGSLGSTLGEPNRATRADTLREDIARALNGVAVPIPFVLDDDHIGTTILKLSRADLSPGVRDKVLPIKSSEGDYDLTFRIVQGLQQPVTVDTSALFQLHADGRIFKFVGPPLTGWQELDKNPATKGLAASAGRLYQLHGNGRIFKFTGTPLTGWQELDNNPATVDIVADGTDLYQLHGNGRIFKFTGTPLIGWQELDNNPDTKKIVAAGGRLYQLHKSGRIFKFTGPPLTGWQELDKNPATVDIVADGADLYQLHGDGRIFKFTGTPLIGWQELDKNPDTKKIVAAGGRLYQLHKSGRVFKFTGTPLTGWQEFDNNPATVDIVAGNNDLYQFHADGRIFKFMGKPITGWLELDNNPTTKKIFASGG